MASRRRRSRKSLGSKLTYINQSVVQSAQTSVPTQLSRVIDDEAIVKGGITQEAITPQSIDARLFNPSAAMPTGEAGQRVPAPLTNRDYWGQVAAGDVELHLGGVHGTSLELEDILNVEATTAGLSLIPTADEPARIYLTGRLTIPPSRKIYAAWQANDDIEMKLIWWKQAPNYDIDSAITVDGLTKISLNSGGLHSFAVGDTIHITNTNSLFDGTHIVVKVSGEDVYYVDTLDITSSVVTAATYTQSTRQVTLTIPTGVGPFAGDGYILFTGTDGASNFEGVYKVASHDSTLNTVSFVVDQDVATVLSISLTANARATFYAIDTAASQESQIEFFPPGKANEDIYYYVNLQNREVWSADKYSHRLLSYSITNNVASVVSVTPTYMMPGDTVQIIAPTEVEAARFNSYSYTVTAVSADTRTVSFALTSANVASTNFSTQSVIKTQNQFLPDSYAVYVEIPAGSQPVLLSSAKVFEVLGESTTEPTYSRVTRSSLTNNLATITVINSTGYNIDSQMVVTGLGAPYDGTFTIASAGASTVRGVEIIANGTAYIAVSNTAPFYAGSGNVSVTVTGTNTVADKTYTTISSVGSSLGITGYAVANGVITLSVNATPYGFVNGVVEISGIGTSEVANVLSNNTWVANTNTATTVTLFGSATYANSVPINASATGLSGTAKVRTLKIDGSGLSVVAPTATTAALAQTNTINYVISSANVAANTSPSINALAVGYTGVEHSELTPTGLTLYNEDGSVSVRLSSQDISTIAVGDSTQGQATISYIGEGSFASVASSGTLTVTGDTTLSSNVTIGGGLNVTGSFSVGEGTTGDISITGNIVSSSITAATVVSNNYTFFSPSASAAVNLIGTAFDGARYTTVSTTVARNVNAITTDHSYYSGDILDRIPRGIIYSVSFDGLDGNNYTPATNVITMAAGKFYAHPDRELLIAAGVASLRTVTASNVSIGLEVIISNSATNLFSPAGTFDIIYSTYIQSGTLGQHPPASIPIKTTELTSQFPDAPAFGASGIYYKGYLAVGPTTNSQPIFWAVRYRMYSTAATTFTNGAIDSLSANGAGFFRVYDMGKAIPTAVLRKTTTHGDNFVTTATGSYPSTTTNTNTNVATYVYTSHTATAIINSSTSAYFDGYGIGDAGTTDVYSNQQSLYQGNAGTSSGTKKSQVAFEAINSTSLGVPNTAVACTIAGINSGYVAGTINAGYKVTKVELYLRNRHSYQGSGLTAYWGYSSDTNARNSSAPPGPYASAGQASASFTKGQGKYTALSTAAQNYFAGGQIRSVLLGLTNATSNTYYSSLTYYGYFDGDLQSDPPKLRVTYTYYTRVLA